MRGRRTAHRVGSLRPSQFLFANGIGSVVDLPSISALVMGIDAWDMQRCEPVVEPRLLQVLKTAFGDQVGSLRALPFSLDEGDAGQPADETIGVPVEPFPGWMVCPICRNLMHVDSGLLELKASPYRPEQTHYVHKTCRFGTRRPSVPARFMKACPAGHLDDLPWVEFVHRGPSACAARLRIDQFGVTGEAALIQVRCLECDAKRSMAEAFGPDADPLIQQCHGRHPHLPGQSEQPCARPARTIVLGATNSWFPVTYSVISVPGQVNELAQLVERNVQSLAPATSFEVLSAFLQLDQEPFRSLARFGAAKVWEEIERQRQLGEEPPESGERLRPPEWRVFTAPELPRAEDFKARIAPPIHSLSRWLERVVLVDRMRMVQALVGFTRLEAPDEPDAVAADAEATEPAPLSLKPPRWIPAAESRGEGIFLQFRESAIEEWTAKPELAEAYREYLGAHRAELARRHQSLESRPFPGLRYLLLHSFAHALMRRISLDCGYAAASLRERIYSLDPTDPDGPMAGVLISTSAPDSEGTLGGLVRLGEPDLLAWHIRAALEEIAECASDPFCAEHRPGADDGSLHGAACHACLFAPETSCEIGNRFLDRGVLVETFAESTTAFFDEDGD